MARQRLGQRLQHYAGRWGLRALLLAGWILLVASCGGEPRTPTGLGGGPTGPPGIGGGSGGGTGGTGSSGPLVGQWRNTLVIEVGPDIQRILTTWTFDSETRCSRGVETYSVLEDRLHFSLRRCSYLVDAREIQVLYDDAQEPVFFEYSFPNHTDDRILIGQFEFFRLF